jgi:hypothetical protein
MLDDYENLPLRPGLSMRGPVLRSLQRRALIFYWPPENPALKNWPDVAE